MAWSDRDCWMSDTLDQGSLRSAGEERPQRIVCKPEETGWYEKLARINAEKESRNKVKLFSSFF
jgi:hypothetical protein